MAEHNNYGIEGEEAWQQNCKEEEEEEEWENEWVWVDAEWLEAEWEEEEWEDEWEWLEAEWEDDSDYTEEEYHWWFVLTHEERMAATHQEWLAARAPQVAAEAEFLRLAGERIELQRIERLRNPPPPPIPDPEDWWRIEQEEHDIQMGIQAEEAYRLRRLINAWRHTRKTG